MIGEIRLEVKICQRLRRHSGKTTLKAFYKMTVNQHVVDELEGGADQHDMNRDYRLP